MQIIIYFYFTNTQIIFKVYTFTFINVISNREKKMEAPKM